MQKSQLMQDLNLNATQFNRLAQERSLSIKDTYTPEEAALLKASAPKTDKTANSKAKQSAKPKTETAAIAKLNQDAIASQAKAVKAAVRAAIEQYATDADAVTEQGSEVIVQITEAIPAMMFTKAAEKLDRRGSQSVDVIEFEDFEIPAAALPFFELRSARGSIGALPSA